MMERVTGCCLTAITPGVAPKIRQRLTVERGLFPLSRLRGRVGVRAIARTQQRDGSPSPDRAVRGRPLPQAGEVKKLLSRFRDTDSAAQRFGSAVQAAAVVARRAGDRVARHEIV